MNFEAHFSTVFQTPELAEEFLKEVMKQLNDITFNGANKIDKVTRYGGSVTVRTPEFKKSKPATYALSVSKLGTVTLG